MQQRKELSVLTVYTKHSLFFKLENGLAPLSAADKIWGITYISVQF